jgi:hypothetical protein
VKLVLVVSEIAGRHVNVYFGMAEVVRPCIHRQKDFVSRFRHRVGSDKLPGTERNRSRSPVRTRNGMP